MWVTLGSRTPTQFGASSSMHAPLTATPHTACNQAKPEHVHAMRGMTATRVSGACRMLDRFPVLVLMTATGAQPSAQPPTLYMAPMMNLSKPPSILLAAKAPPRTRARAPAHSNAGAIVVGGHNPSRRHTATAHTRWGMACRAFGISTISTNARMRSFGVGAACVIFNASRSAQGAAG